MNFNILKKVFQQTSAQNGTSREININRNLSPEESVRIQKSILKDKSLLNQTDVDNRSLLHATITHGHIELAKFLIDLGIDVNHQDVKQNTALHYCAAYYHYELAEYILKNNGNLNLEDKYGNQPLWTALANVKKGLIGLDLVKLYLSYGADRDHENKVKKSPMSRAIMLGVQEIIDVLNGT